MLRRKSAVIEIDYALLNEYDGVFLVCELNELNEYERSVRSGLKKSKRKKEAKKEKKIG